MFGDKQPGKNDSRMAESHLEEGFMNDSSDDAHTPAAHTHISLTAAQMREKLKKKPCLLRLWCVIEIQMLKMIDDPKQVKENMRMQMSSIALVGALLGTSQFASFS